MTKHLNREISGLRDELVDQFAVVEQMIQLSVRSLVERRPDLASRVIETDDQVDQKDVQIEENCLKLLALHQPVATDLRWVTTVIKINGGIERMADLACNIAERAKALDLYPLFPIPEEINEMVLATSTIVRDALDSFVDDDADKARAVIKFDDQIDGMNRQVIETLQDLMRQDPDWIIPGMHCFSASRHLERIGDVAEHIAEEVVYLVEGEIVRHRHD